MEQTEENNEIVIPVYVIENADSGKITEEFNGKSEFELNIVTLPERGAANDILWQMLVEVINLAIKKDEDVIIICSGNHRFSEKYRKHDLIENIIEAYQQGVNVLFGGIGGFKRIVPVTPNRCWIDWCRNIDFIIIYKRFFNAILKEPFTDQDIAAKFSEMTSNKMIVYPLISITENSGYPNFNKSKTVMYNKGTPAEDINERLDHLMMIYNKYKKMACAQKSY